MSATALIGTAIATGVASYQRHQEKKRQEKIDQYNKDLNDRNFVANQMQNSPAYQMQRMKDAGFNPLASGIAPDFQSPTANTTTLNPQPMETSSVADAIGSGVNAMLQERATEQKDKELDLEQQRIDLQRDVNQFNMNKAQVDQYVEMWNADLIPHNDETKRKLAELFKSKGFEMTISEDGNISLKSIADRNKVQSETILNNQKLATEKAITAQEEAKARYADRSERLKAEKLRHDIALAIEDKGIKIKHQEAQEIANRIELLQEKRTRLQYDFERTGVSESSDPEVRAAVAQLATYHPAFFDDMMKKSFSNSEIDKKTYEAYVKWAREARETDKIIEQSERVTNAILHVVDTCNPKSWIMPKQGVHPPLRQSYRESFDSHGTFRGATTTTFSY